MRIVKHKTTSSLWSLLICNLLSQCLSFRVIQGGTKATKKNSFTQPKSDIFQLKMLRIYQILKLNPKSGGIWQLYSYKTWSIQFKYTYLFLTKLKSIKNIKKILNYFAVLLDQKNANIHILLKSIPKQQIG